MTILDGIPPQVQTKCTDANIKQLVKAWINNPSCTEEALGHIRNWDVSSVSNMSYLFSNSLFLDDISSWDVSNVKNMKGMFENTVLYNQNFNDWDLSNVQNVEDIIKNTKNFDQKNNIHFVKQIANNIFDTQIIEPTIPAK